MFASQTWNALPAVVADSTTKQNRTKQLKDLVQINKSMVTIKYGYFCNMGCIEEDGSLFHIAKHIGFSFSV